MKQSEQKNDLLIKLVLEKRQIGPTIYIKMKNPQTIYHRIKVKRFHTIETKPIAHQIE